MNVSPIKLVSCFAFAVTLVSCGSSKPTTTVNVMNVRDMPNAVNNSVVYNLPITALRIDVTAVKTIHKVGPFYRYAQKYFNLTNIITEDSESWSIKSVNIVPFGKVDKFKTFAILQEGPGAAQNISVNSQGILYGVNSESDCLPIEQFQNTNIGSLPSLESTTFDAVPMLEKQLLATSTAMMAEETAQHIYKLRKRHSRIFTADYEVLPPDGDAFSQVQDVVGKLESDFLELFAGKEVTIEVKRSFEFIPSPESVDNNVLFRFSDKKGFLDRLDLSGTPMYAEVKKLDTRQLPDAVVETKGKKSAPNGLFYCSPGIIEISIVDKNISIYKDEFEAAQFGQLLSLPSSLMTQPGLSIEISPITGTITRIQTKK